jgi:hypothetical protein
MIMSKACPGHPRDRGGEPINAVQHRSAAATAHLTDRHQPLPSSTKSGETFSDHAATVYGSEGWGFESLQERKL